MSVAENKARYEGSVMQQLMEGSGHMVCDRCYCCDATTQSATCWQCNGMTEEWQDEWDDGYCSVCQGEGEIYFTECLGRCDEEGNHKK